LEIIVAGQAGFCFGVKRALDRAHKALREVQEPLFSLGELVHNQAVCDRLAREGIRVVNGLDEIDRGRVLIRTHGEGPDVFDGAREKDLEVVDATCPYVRRVQRRARELAQDGRTVVVVGDRGHPEVTGILSWSLNRGIVVENACEAQNVPPALKLGVVTQTTQNEENVAEVLAVLRQKTSNLVFYDTVCKATRERQDAARALSRQVDIMVVVGGHHSANTRKLTEICRESGTPTYQVENAGELQKAWFRQAAKVGVTAGASTPDWIIEEVVGKMAEFTPDEEKIAGNQNEQISSEEATTPEEPVSREVEVQEATAESSESEQNDRAEFEAQMAEGMNQLKKGAIISGTVVRINDNEVMIDVGAKSEGLIPLSELSHRPVQDPHEVVQEGDTIEVQVIRVENEEGHPIVSKKRADRKSVWANLEEAYQEGREIVATVTEVVKGGLLVDIGTNGFVPASLVERGYVENLDKYLGQSLRLRIIELDRSKNKVVLSQKAILDEEYEKKRQDTWETLEEGQVLKGVVRRLTNFGAFIDIGGVDGLLHVSEIAWGRVEHPRDVLSEGQEVEVQVLGIDREKGKVSLGRKQLLSNPWDTAAANYPPGTVVEGKVLRIAPFGAFVEVEPGIEGLVHISQLAPQHVEKTEDVVQVGDVIPVKVLSVDQNAQRMSLSLKEARNNNSNRKPKKANEKPAQSTTNEGSGVTLGDLFGDLFEDEK